MRLQRWARAMKNEGRSAYGAAVVNEELRGEGMTAQIEKQQGSHEERREVRVVFDRWTAWELAAAWRKEVAA